MAKMNQQGKTLSSLIEVLPRPVEEREIRMKITCPDHAKYGNLILDKMTGMVEKISGWTPEKPNHEGIRVKCEGTGEDGWFLLRMSLHDPLMPLNVESNIDGGVAVIVKKLKRLLDIFKSLDNSPLYL